MRLFVKPDQHTILRLEVAVHDGWVQVLHSIRDVDSDLQQL